MLQIDDLMRGLKLGSRHRLKSDGKVYYLMRSLDEQLNGSLYLYNRDENRIVTEIDYSDTIEHLDRQEVVEDDPKIEEGRVLAAYVLWKNEAPYEFVKLILDHCQLQPLECYCEELSPMVQKYFEDCVQAV